MTGRIGLTSLLAFLNPVSAVPLELLSIGRWGNPGLLFKGPSKFAGCPKPAVYEISLTLMKLVVKRHFALSNLSAFMKAERPIPVRLLNILRYSIHSS